MICVHCYKEVPDGSKFCPHCGKSVDVGYGMGNGNIDANYENNKSINSTCLAGLITACISALLIDPFGLLSISGFVLSAKGYRTVLITGERGMKQAKLGMGISIFEFIIKVMLIISL